MASHNSENYIPWIIGSAFIYYAYSQGWFNSITNSITGLTSSTTAPVGITTQCPSGYLNDGGVCVFESACAPGESLVNGVCIPTEIAQGGK